MAGRKNNGGTLDEILHGLIARNPEHSVPDLAEDLGVQEYVLYEWGNPHQKRKFPLSMVIPLCRVTGDTSLVEHVAASLGLVATKIRKRGKSGIEHLEDIQECVESFSSLLLSLTEAFRDRNKVDRRATLAAIDKFMGALAGFRQDVENLSEQFELELE